MSVTVDVPVTLRITVSFADAAPADQHGAAAAVAAEAAASFSHVTEARIAAFNEVHRLHPHGPGTVEAVAADVHAPLKRTA
ncbi:hypothetical protein [Azospirillum sp. A39]|uniref:hypothetical protein n=1 Tax=Azospirillum sp. A39 TaxID=3462279 RepID=UPI0040453C31